MDMDGIYIAGIPLKLWLKMNDPEDEIFRRSCKMINNFVSEVKAPPTEKVVDKLIKLDETLQNVIDLIRNLVKSLDKIKNKAEISFWNSQITKLKEDVDNQIEIHVESFEKDPEKDREFIQRASQELLALRRVAGLDWKGFAKLIGSLVFTFSHRGKKAHSDTWVGIITLGEGFHEAHHVNARTALWHPLDLGGQIIRMIDSNAKIQ